ncbi:MAG: cob(I)yrinic acid a,c-diamide adenosyltransferase [Planctomycetota bacterium]
MKIYTRTGDSGETGLFGGGRVAKDALRVEAYGAVDELNAAIGLARAAGLPEALDAVVGRLQSELFDLGADLATPPGTSAREEKVVRVTPEQVARLEEDIDACEEGLPPLDAFILPGGGPAGAGLHLARTICRRAERRTVELARSETVSPQVVPYLNRLSDLLFVLARAANAADGRPEQKWLS